MAKQKDTRSGGSGAFEGSNPQQSFLCRCTTHIYVRGQAGTHSRPVGMAKQ